VVMRREIAPAMPCGVRSSTVRATDFTRDRLAFCYATDTE
jgi:hypothetical protein